LVIDLILNRTADWSIQLALSFTRQLPPIRGEFIPEIKTDGVCRLA